MPNLFVHSRTILWWMIGISSWYVAWFTVIYFDFDPNTFFLSQKPEILKQQSSWMISFYVHIMSAMLCLLVGPFQFSARLRNRWKKAHRQLGKLYVGSILVLAAPSGLYLAVYANGTWGTRVGFFVLSLIWAYSTWRAYTAARSAQFFNHRAWMIRSYALSFSAVTLRMLWMPLLSLGTDLSEEVILTVTAFINWIPNLVFAEWYIHRQRIHSGPKLL